MKHRLNSQTGFFFGLVLALFLGWLNQPPMVLSLSGQPTQVNTMPGFNNIPHGWKAKLVFHPSSPPELISITQIGAVRIPPPSGSGDYSVRMLDANATELYTQTFQIYFIRAGVSGKLDSVEHIILLPPVPGATKLVVESPFGEKTYEIPRQ